ncbi:hypothetical protein D9M71_687960 [compost metagenome]
MAMYEIVFPKFCSEITFCSKSLETEAPISSISFLFPKATLTFSIVPKTPFPAIVSKP